MVKGIPTHHHFIVVSKERGPAACPATHSYLLEATTEARRLAEAFPRDTFVVYEAVRVVEAPKVSVLDLIMRDEEPPF